MAYNGKTIELFGETNLRVSYNDKIFTHKFLVVPNKINLLGRDLCKQLGIKILLPDQVNFTRDIQSEFKEFLSDSYCSNVKETVQLEVDKNATPIYAKSRPVPVKLRDKLKGELQRLVGDGKLTRVFKSKWASPIVTVFKKDGSLRICGDFSATVNRFLDPVQTPLPTVDDTISRIGKATVFSKIDLSQAFLQIPLDDQSKQYTVINTPEGLFQYNYLPFGLTASPGLFQSFLTQTLSHIDNIIIYQDDVLILTKDVDSHNDTLRAVLKALRDKGIKINSQKCKLLCESVDYLGHIFDKSGVHPNPTKVKSIFEAPAPKNVKQVQSFLGLCNYYSRFIPNFAQTMSPLYYLLKKDTRFEWTAAQQDSFDTVKQLFNSNDILQHYNPEHQLKLETDASSYGIGAVLLTRANDELPWLPIQFASRTLNDHEINYSNIEREALSIIFGLKKFRNFLLGSKFIICNDQKPLTKLFSNSKPVPTSCSARILHWALQLSQYNYILEYSRGQENVHSDFLSRLPLPDSVTEAEPYEIICTLESLEKDYVTPSVIKTHTDSDPNLIILKQYIRTGCPDRFNNKTLSKFKSIIPDLTITKGCIMYQNRVFIPEALRTKVLNLFHENHPGIVAMKALTRSLIWYPGLDRDVTNLVQSCKICQSVRCKPAKSNVSWPLPSRPWSRIHIDHFFPDNSICLIVVDALTKYIEVEIVKSTSTKETIDTLSLIFARNGLPDILVSDNAPGFTSYEFDSFLTKNGIEHLTPPPYCPASNGQAERGVRVIKDMLMKSSPNVSFKYKLAKVLLQYRSVPHNTTHVSPAVALNKRKLITMRDRINPHFGIESHEKKNTDSRHFDIGSSVLALNVRGEPKWYQATVVEKIGVNVYNVQVHDLNIIWKRHSNQLLSIPKCSLVDKPIETTRLTNNATSNKSISQRNRKPPDRLTYY